MTRSWAAALGVLVTLASLACGPGGNIPPTKNGTGTEDPIEIPKDPDKQPETKKSFWPLTAQSRWKYRITDPLVPVFEKTVEVIGAETVPGTDITAFHVKSSQPHLEEHSWQTIMSGLVVRVREDDRKPNAQQVMEQVRSTTWKPSNVKAIAEEVGADWTHQSVVKERVDFSDGTWEEKDRTYEWRVLGVNVPVEVPAGKFDNAIHLERRRPDKEDWIREYWLVPGIGKVKETGERLEELLEYDVKE